MPLDRITNIKLRVKASIALTTVILIGAILISSGVSVLMNASDIAFTSKAYLQSSISNVLYTSCLEETLTKLSHNQAYTGTFTITFGPASSCTSTTNNDTVNTTKIITIQSIDDGFVMTRIKKVDTTFSPLKLTN